MLLQQLTIMCKTLKKIRVLCASTNQHMHGNKNATIWCDTVLIVDEKIVFGIPSMEV